MSQAYIQCPETEQFVYVGLNFEWLQLESMEFGEQTLDCRKCGHSHIWTKQDVILRVDCGG